ncbi:MAG: hypothetical protein SFV19_04250 [Rhodospirillaceae bacterium]|nr:hypothetical protein [Rhodospirillaceae bacterium]
MTLGGLGFGSLLFDGGIQRAEAKTQARAAYTPPGMQANLPEEAGRLERASFTQRGKFDLASPSGRRLARLKTIGSLDGQPSYMAYVTRHIWCAPNRPAVPLMNELELLTTFLERPPADENKNGNTFLHRLIVTRVPVDPETLAPITSVKIPGGPPIQLVDTVFAMTLKLDMSPDAAPEPLLQHDRAHYELGEDTAFTMFDARSGEGPHQPRVDMSIWTVKTADLMSPAVGALRSSYSFTAIMRANVFGWTELPSDDQTQVLRQKIGVKTPEFDSLPQSVKMHIVEAYPARHQLTLH